MNHVTKTGALLKHFMIIIIIIIVSWIGLEPDNALDICSHQIVPLLAQDVFFGNKRSCLGILFASSFRLFLHCLLHLSRSLSFLLDIYMARKLY